MPFILRPARVDEYPQPPGTPVSAGAPASSGQGGGSGGTAHPRNLSSALTKRRNWIGAILGKPGDHERRGGSITAVSGRVVRFHTGLCVLDTRTVEAVSTWI